MKYNLADNLDRNQAISKFKNLLDKKARVEVKEIKPRRSLSSNAYYHVCVSLFAIEFGWTMQEAKDQLKKLCPFMRYEKISKRTGKMVVFYKQTSLMDSKEMTEYIEWIRNYSNQNGCYLPTPEEYYNGRERIDNTIENHKQYL